MNCPTRCLYLADMISFLTAQNNWRTMIRLRTFVSYVVDFCSGNNESCVIVLTFHGFGATIFGFFMAVAQEVLLTALLEKVHVEHG